MRSSSGLPACCFRLYRSARHDAAQTDQLGRHQADFEQTGGYSGRADHDHTVGSRDLDQVACGLRVVLQLERGSQQAQALRFVQDVDFLFHVSFPPAIQLSMLRFSFFATSLL